VIRGVSHITLSVRDLDRALAFYRDVLDARPSARWEQGAYLVAGDLWLCLSVDPATRSAPLDEYTHVALAVGPEDFGPMSERVVASGARIWQDNRSEGDSLYFLDPDGHKLELHVGDLQSRLAALCAEPSRGTVLEQAARPNGSKA
jgi:catechol 2,3-dioxygenase-like lactoylglutathione lyase family enzyme